MKVPKFLKFAGNYDKYPPNGTTYAELISYLTNQNELVELFTNYAWQPLKNFPYKSLIVSPNMPAGFCAVVQRSGKSSDQEPAWQSNVTEYNDGGVIWKLKSIGSGFTVDGIKPGPDDNVELPVMEGATAGLNGKAGKVPQPMAGEDNSALFGDGSFRKVIQTINGAEADANGNVNIISLPIGFEFFTFSSVVPENAVPYFGETYSRTKYAKLWQKANEDGRVISEEKWQQLASENGTVGYYSTGDGTTTFRVPKINSGTIWGADMKTQAGRHLRAALPEIEGNFPVDTLKMETNGVFQQNSNLLKSTTRLASKNVGETISSNIGFVASRYNPIYGRSKTVVPPSTVCIFCVIALESTISTSNYSMMSNAPTPSVASLKSAPPATPSGKRYVVETYQNGKNWYEIYNDGWIRQGGLCSANDLGRVTLLIPMQGEAYTIIPGALTAPVEGYDGGIVKAVTASYFEWNQKNVSRYWTVEGMGAG